MAKHTTILLYLFFIALLLTVPPGAAAQKAKKQKGGKGKKCKDPGPIANGYTAGAAPNNKGKFADGAAIVYFCNDGFQLNGAETITCDNGVFSASSPSCIKPVGKSCNDPGTPIHGSRAGASPKNIKGSKGGGLRFANKSQIQYSCDPDYALIGSASRTCVNGGWTGDPVICAVSYSVAFDGTTLNDNKWWKEQAAKRKNKG